MAMAGLGEAGRGETCLAQGDTSIAPTKTRKIRLLLASTAEDRVFGGLGDAELDLLALGDLDGLSGHRPETHHHFASRAFGENELADAGDDEGVLRLSVGEVGLRLEEVADLLLADADL